MRSKVFAALAATFVCASAAFGAAPNWLVDMFLVRAPQTQVVRDPVYSGRYYLCWQESGRRYGIHFQRSRLENNLRSVRPGSRVSLSTMLAVRDSDWSKRDEQICWGR